MTSSTKRARVGQSRLFMDGDSLEMRAADLSRSVASETQGTGALRGAGLVHLFIGGVFAVSMLPLAAMAGAIPTVSEGHARLSDTAVVAPARSEAGQTVAVGVGADDPVPAFWGGSASAPIATDYTGSERVAPAALWSAIVEHFPHHEHTKALQVAHCESRYKADAVSTEGARGVFQVIERYHGPVPRDVNGQTAQAARIQRAHGWSPWDCA